MILATKKMQAILVCIIGACSSFTVHAATMNYCHPGNSTCWPTAEEIDELNRVMQSQSKACQERKLKWDGLGSPLPCPIPYLGNQPLYGLGAENNLRQIYVESEFDKSQTCFQKMFNASTTPHVTEYCNASVRNNPPIHEPNSTDSSTPAFTAFPDSVANVQSLIRFARDHRLCVSVTGSGHDFLQRHSCNSSLLIRTSLLRHPVVWGKDNETMTVSSSSTFSMLQFEASKRGRFVVSGWSSSVGIAGFSLGGGHGPVSPSNGLGVDNIISADLVLANGDFVTVSATNHSDLWWALRGGGGSTWGILIDFTIRAHENPTNGFTHVSFVSKGTLCDSKLEGFLHDMATFMLSLDSLWAGKWDWYPKQEPHGESCNASYTLDVAYVYQGGLNDSAFTKVMANFDELLDSTSIVDRQVVSLPTYWDLMMHRNNKHGFLPIFPFSWCSSIPGKAVGGQPSVLVSRSTLQHKAVQKIFESLQSCKRPSQGGKSICLPLYIYQDLTGNIGSPQTGNVSISQGLREAILHIVVGGRDEVHAQNHAYMEGWYELGMNSYFGESAMDILVDGYAGGWQRRYWGRNYGMLLQVKSRYDPEHAFWCRHCVGDAER